MSMTIQKHISSLTALRRYDTIASFAASVRHMIEGKRVLDFGASNGLSMVA